MIKRIILISVIYLPMMFVATLLDLYSWWVFIILLILWIMAAICLIKTDITKNGDKTND